jgi:CspA family cold shock protein
MSAINATNLNSPSDLIGTVKWFNEAKGYGFIRADGIESDIFAHYKHLIPETENEFRVLVKNQLVLFEPTDTSKGIMATKIRKIKH